MTVREQDIQFYNGIWQRRKHICYQCKKYLGEEPLTIYFHHLLGKKRWPIYRHVGKNIVLLCFHCHGQAEINIDKVPLVKKRRDEVLDLHYKNQLYD